MAPKRSSRAKAGALAQPTISFQTRKPGVAGKKGSLASVKSQSTASIQSQRAKSPSAHSIVIEDESASTPALHAAKQAAVEIVSKTKREGRARLDVRNKQWNGVVKAARVEMGGMSPKTHNEIHRKSIALAAAKCAVSMRCMKTLQSGIIQRRSRSELIPDVLRVFDLTASYGPCVGVTRLQRWERAKKWGLNPPDEIKSILTTEQGEDEAEYRENVLHAWLG